MPLMPLAPSEIEPVGKPKFQLQKLLDGQTLQVLETSVKAGVTVLDTLKDLLSRSDQADARQWIDQVDRVRNQAINRKTIVGVVGNTGAVKPSVINALLDEERLVPTNCMRACTAVITEISYNTDEAIPYRADLEFIAPADWRRELQILFQELLDSNGSVSRECANEDTEAGVAYAKIKSVYPKMTKEMIEDSSVDKLMREPIFSVLGTTKQIRERDALLFYKKLQAIIDSKEKVDKAKAKDTSEKSKPREPALWPLIKVVRLYVKHSALETGAVIVDLPGVHDSNAARAKVAENYMESCTSLWIVAPINRAVDDKLAKTLLGETFKRQLKMDSAFNTVTFICSKSDDISVLEAQDSLGLEERFEQYESELRRYNKEIKNLKGDLDDQKSAREELDTVIDKIGEDMDVWETMKDDAESGKIVFAPETPKSKKRKIGKRESSSSKRRRRSRSDDDDSDDSYVGESDQEALDEDKDEDEEEDISKTPKTITLEDIQTRIGDMKAKAKDSRQQKAESITLMRDIRRQLREVQDKVDAIEFEKRAKCIAGRNEYSRAAIQSDFASGIREIDQEIGEEEDAANFNPEEDTRDYDEVARSLPVFCVSSRAYQQLQGRFQQEAKVPGFRATEETQIPQLQAHCKSLTINGRTTACNHFLAALSQLLNSLVLWGSNDGSGSNLTKEQKARQNQQLQASLRQLEPDLDKQVAAASKSLSSEFEENLYDRFDQATPSAVDNAIQAVLQWNAPYIRGDPQHSGFHWATYKAICRRNGSFRDATHEWNTILAEPIMRQIAPGWERCFGRRVSRVWQSFTQDAEKTLKHFHETVAKRAQTTGSGAPALYILGQQQGVYANLLKQIAEKVVEEIGNRQRDINREFTPIILEAMTPGYEICTNEHGPGSFKRMKAHLSAHVNDVRHSMFRDSVSNVRDLLEELVHTTKESTILAVDEVYKNARRDYVSAIGGGSTAYGEVMSKEQRLIRKEVVEVVEDSENVFEKVVQGDWAAAKVEDPVDEETGEMIVDKVDEETHKVDQQVMKTEEHEQRARSPAVEPSVVPEMERQGQ